ncbi:hypothetical protein D3C80_1937350 [compost metagenome]
MQDFFEIVFAVIDHDICTEALHPLHIRGTRGRRYGRPQVFGQLNGQCSHATGARMN